MSTVAVLFGGPTPEHDINILTGLQAARVLGTMGHSVLALYWSKQNAWYSVAPDLEGSAFVDGTPKDAKALLFRAQRDGGFFTEAKGVFAKSSPVDFDVALVCCHGGPGEDGSLQGALDLAGVRYAGPSLMGAAIGMDKLAFSRVLQASDIPTLPRVLLTESTENISFGGPYILKPRFGGSSIGIEVVDSLETAKALLRTSVHFRAGVVIEPYKPGSYDLNVALRLFPEPQTSAIEKPTRASSANQQILGYADKYVGGEGMVSAPRELPAQIDQKTEAFVRKTAIRVAEICDVRGLPRLDFLVDGKHIYVNELNTIPGSLTKHLWVNPVVPFETLLRDLLQEAYQRPTTHWTTEGADGVALRSAGSIAAKLS